MNFLSYFLQRPVSSVCYILAAIGYTIAFIKIYRDYKKSKKLSHTQKAILIALGCSFCLFDPPQFLEDGNPSAASILIGLAVFVLALLSIFIIIFKLSCSTNKK